jgi:hypothetical protein
MSTARKLWHFIGICAVAALVSACHETTSSMQLNLPPGTTPEQRAEAERLIAKAQAIPAERVSDLQAVTTSPEALTAFLSNTTVRTYDGYHGSQIEHLTADGRTFLWYPENMRLVPGLWTTRKVGARVQMCFQYGANTYNPADNTRGGNWECRGSRGYLIGAEEIAEGDPLSLASGRLPFALQRGNVSINDALKQSGRTANASNKITW